MPAIPTLRQLRYLVALDDHHHFGHAADACAATQSTLSAGLQELEAILGANLVERTKRKVLITPLGQEVVARARSLLRGAEDLVDLVRSASEPLSGEIRLGVIPTIGPYLLPQILPALRAAHPNLRLYLREDLSARLLDLLGTGELDLVLLALPYRADEFESHALFDDPFLLAFPPGYALGEGEHVRSSDIPIEDLLLLEEGHCLRDHALAACHLAAPFGKLRGRQDRLLATSLATLVQMVAGGLGVTLLPRLALDGGVLAGTGLLVRSLGADAPARSIGLTWRSASPRQAEFRLLGEEILKAHAALNSSAGHV
ncbi:LysR substrate-binding domain-containing protein [Telmatospirillum sp.]|uniref:hydrogen peroxide-inducible genes activator n=1 Tax=Telmatospirillum sp. TaxID=2079197 RepID=UPI00284141A4|nr:LysR substrate-binding domain-containing protein [Telmatospirillum sp.]MDR3437116.1 LysR substrate-binding domain-containing protein [Telmatospirillum sp.]